MTLPLSPGGRRYGFLPSPKDHRDYGAFRLLSPVAIPPSYDLEQWMGAVKDQGNEGSCTAHAGTSNTEYLLNRYRNLKVTLSPAFLYYCERQLEGSLAKGDCGAYGRSAVRVLQSLGCCTLASSPYTPGEFSTPPTPAQLTEALIYKAGAYHAISNVDEGKHCIASGYPFLIGFTVYESFEEDLGADATMPRPKGFILGGHEVLVIGYDDARQAFKVRNSWGPRWGSHGNFWFPYQYCVKLWHEAWIQHLGKAW